MGIVLFIPGYFLVLATFLNKKMSPLETFVISFGSSVIITDLIIILIGKSPLHITSASIFGTIVLFSLICLAIYLFRKKRKNEIIENKQGISHDRFPIKSAALILLIVFLTIFIRTIYFKDTIFPTTTDLGHHMYWSKQIAITGNLPQYEKADIGQDFTIGEPQPIADFIIGEHIIFAAISIISGAEFISAFPGLVLFLIQIISLLAIFILTREIFKKAEHRYGDAIAITTLFLIGPLYAFATPQAKFVSGGVIGNIIGNLLIPLAIYFYVRAFSEKKSSLLAWALFFSFGLAYTHHLSTFVFIFIALFTFISFAALNFRTVFLEACRLLRLILSPSVLTVIATGIIFTFFVYTPSYFNQEAIDTAVGTPSKSTRTGLTLSQLKTTAGEARFAFAVAGIILLFFVRKIGKYRQAFMIGWIAALTLMSIKPDWLFVDIPSNRIASYIVFPIAIIAACMLVHIFILFRNKNENTNKNYIGPVFILITFFAFMMFVSADGFNDNANSLNTDSSANKALQTYAAAQYLAEHSGSDDIILKDHNYLSGDTWIKLFFMRGYNYPLSRGYFKRYEDSPSREQCTNLMISAPSSPEANKCFVGTKTNFTMVNPRIDSGQFNKLNNFWQVYSSDEVGIYYRKDN